MFNNNHRINLQTPRSSYNSTDLNQALTGMEKMAIKTFYSKDNKLRDIRDYSPSLIQNETKENFFRKDKVDDEFIQNFNEFLDAKNKKSKFQEMRSLRKMKKMKKKRSKTNPKIFEELWRKAQEREDRINFNREIIKKNQFSFRPNSSKPQKKVVRDSFFEKLSKEKIKKKKNERYVHIKKRNEEKNKRNGSRNRKSHFETPMGIERTLVRYIKERGSIHGGKEQESKVKFKKIKNLISKEIDFLDSDKNALKSNRIPQFGMKGIFRGKGKKFTQTEKCCFLTRRYSRMLGEDD